MAMSKPRRDEYLELSRKDRADALALVMQEAIYWLDIADEMLAIDEATAMKRRMQLKVV